MVINNYFIFFNLFTGSLIHLSISKIIFMSGSKETKAHTVTNPELKPIITKRTLTKTAVLNRGLSAYNQQTKTLFLMLTEERWDEISATNIYEIKYVGTKIQHLSFIKENNAPAKINHMFWSDTLIIFSDTRNRLLFIKKFKDERFNRVPTLRGVFKVIFFNDSTEIFATIGSIDDLSITTDSGKNWNVISEGVTHFNWLIEDKKFILLRKSWDNNKNKNLLIGDLKDIKIYDIHENCEDLGIVNKYIYVVCIKNKKKALFFINSDGKMTQAIFPKNINPTKFVLFNTTTNIFYISVQDHDRFILYSGNIKDAKFVKIHEKMGKNRSIFEGNYCIDLKIIPSLPGFLLSNYYLKDYSYPKTIISFNYGKTWSYIQVSKTLELSNCFPPHCDILLEFNCEPFRNNFFIHNSMAPHLMISSGKIKSGYLHFRKKLFISADAGRSWIESIEFHEYVTILNQGGIIFALKQIGGEATYSFDEGQTWFSLNEIGENFIALSLGNSQKSISDSVLVVGYSQSSLEWEIIHIDFSNILKKKCLKHDYNLFTPGARYKDECFNGMRDIFYRKKKHSICLGDINHGENVKVKRCSCTHNDFGCDFGYTFTDGICKVDPDNYIAENTPICNHEFEERKTTMKKFIDNQCLSQYENIEESYLDLCSCTEYDDIIYYLINSKIMFLCLNKLTGLREMKFNQEVLSNLKLFDMDLPNKCLYYYDGNNIRKLCWKKKTESGDKINIIVKTVKNVSHLFFNHLGKNLFFSTNKALFILDIETKNSRTMFELTNIHFFRYMQGIKKILIAGETNDKNSKELYLLDLENKISPHKIEIEDNILGCYLESFSQIIACFTRSQVYRVSGLLGFIMKNELETSMLYKSTYKHNIIVLDKGTKVNGVLIPHFKPSQISYRPSVISFHDSCEFALCKYICVSHIETYSCLCPDIFEEVLGFDCKCKIDNPQCKECQNDQFKCDSGKCIDKNHRCDQHIDCPDGSDEIKCSSFCSKYQEFNCYDNSSCIDSLDRCDGEYDCDDYSDEKYCPRYTSCHHDQFLCINKNCIPKILVCNGFDDCLDNSDETICEVKYCSVDQFQCENEDCIAKKYVCDGKYDCLDWSDEARCTHFKYVENPDCYLYCDGKCIHQSKVCDHITDCDDGIDEIHCDHKIKCISPYEYKCPVENLCLKREQLCDGFSDCEDRSDEVDCKNVTIDACKTFKAYKCKNENKCIERNNVCDQENSCGRRNEEIEECFSKPYVTMIKTTIINENTLYVTWHLKNFNDNTDLNISIFKKNESYSFISIKFKPSINFKMIELAPCVQYHLYVSPNLMEGGKTKEITIYPSSYISPNNIKLNVKKHILFWNLHISKCVPVYYYVECKGYGQFYRNFTSQKFIQLPMKYRWCKVASCPSDVFNISCSSAKFVLFGRNVIHHTFVKLIILFVVPTILSFLFCKIQFIHQFIDSTNLSSLYNVMFPYKKLKDDEYPDDLITEEDFE